MTIQEATEILETYQAWRTGKIDEIGYKPLKISEAFETILKHLKNDTGTTTSERPH